MYTHWSLQSGSAFRRDRKLRYVYIRVWPYLEVRYGRTSLTGPNAACSASKVTNDAIIHAKCHAVWQSFTPADQLHARSFQKLYFVAQLPISQCTHKYPTTVANADVQFTFSECIGYQLPKACCHQVLAGMIRDYGIMAVETAATYQLDALANLK